MNKVYKNTWQREHASTAVFSGYLELGDKKYASLLPVSPEHVQPWPFRSQEKQPPKINILKTS